MGDSAAVEGDPFGRYRLVELLGRGGMGEVWKAYDTETDRVVAVKLLRADLAGDEQFKARFRREAKAAAALHEPHVVPIHNFGDIDGRLYVDMRLISGRDLESMLRDGPLEPARAVDIVAQVASALNAAHERGLVHRDVKPSNVLVADKDFAYLIDFGIARTAADKGLTNTGTTLGTWAYMAPERFSSPEVDARSDVYALACVLYEALTGEKPFPGPSMQQQLTGHLLTAVPRPSAVRAGVPEALDGVIAKGMAKEPGERYATALELARAATAAVASPAPRTGPVARPAPVTRPPVPRPAPVARPAPVPRPQPPRPTYVPVPQPVPTPPTGARIVAPPPALPWWRRPVALVSAVALLVVVAVVVTFAVSVGGDDASSPVAESTSTTTTKPRRTTTTSTPAPLPIDSALLGVPEISQIMGVDALQIAEQGSAFLDDKSTVAPPECTAPTLVVRKVEYANVPVVQTRYKTLSASSPAINSIIENVVLMDSPAAATAFVDNQAKLWEPCQNRQVVSTNLSTNEKITYNFAGFVRRDAMIMLTSSVPPVTCQRAMASRAAYVADVSACSPTVTNQAEVIATTILDRATGA